MEVKFKTNDSQASFIRWKKKKMNEKLDRNLKRQGISHHLDRFSGKGNEESHGDRENE
jgi:hypothetical protein